MSMAEVGGDLRPDIRQPREANREIEKRFRDGPDGTYHQRDMLVSIPTRLAAAIYLQVSKLPTCRTIGSSAACHRLNVGERRLSRSRLERRRSALSSEAPCSTYSPHRSSITL